jgi:2-oxoglutarate/2-oxoacid ferredoxin oxidoreductase subunit beta
MVVTVERQEVTAKDYKTEQKSTWCPGCGDFGILNAVQTALISAKIAPWQVMLVSGIGCGSKLPDYIRANGYMTLHGRGVTIASGVHLANPDLVTIAIGGDGDSFGIGIGHAFHNMRRNIDIVHIVENNEVYGLTKGQYSPVSKKGFITSTSPEGAIETGVNPILLALTAGATFIGYGYSGDPKFTAGVIQKGIEHKGYSLVNVMQTCPSYQKAQDMKWFGDHTFKIEEEIPDYDATDIHQAYALALGTHPVWQKESVKGKLYPLGVIYQDQTKPTYAEQIPVYQKDKTPIVKQSLKVSDEFLAELKKAYV